MRLISRIWVFENDFMWLVKNVIFLIMWVCTLMNQWISNRMFRFRVNIWEKLGNWCVGFRCNFMVVMRLIRMIFWCMSFWHRIWDLNLVKWCLLWIRNNSIVDLSLEYECIWQLGIINWFIIELSIIRYFLGISLRLDRYIHWGVNW
jgi:hypothetical protein